MRPHNTRRRSVTSRNYSIMRGPYGRSVGYMCPQLDPFCRFDITPACDRQTIVVRHSEEIRWG